MEKAQEILENMGIGTRVVSMPCWENFEMMPVSYKRKILPPGSARIAIEAGVQQGWEKWLYGEGGSFKKAEFIGMKSFGASGPGTDLFTHFNITADKIVQKAREILKI